MKKHFAAFLFICLVLSPGIISAQKSETFTGLQFGLNFGAYLPSKYSANYYNGSEKNLNNTQWVMSNRVFYDSIFIKLDAIDTVKIVGWPSNMHYKISMMPGLYAQYTINEEYAICIEFNYMKLIAQDVITFEIPKPFLANPDQRLCVIRGEEKRVYIDLGIKRSIKVSDKNQLFVIGGLNLNNTNVLKSAFYVEGTEYSIINNYINGVYVGPNAQTFNLRQGGIGWGLYLSGGATFHFGNISFEPGFNAHFVNVDLTGYKKLAPGGGIYIRFILNNLFSTD